MSSSVTIQIKHDAGDALEGPIVLTYSPSKGASKDPESGTFPKAVFVNCALGLELELFCGFALSCEESECGEGSAALAVTPVFNVGNLFPPPPWTLLFCYRTIQF